MNLKEIKKFCGHPNDWMRESTDENIPRLVEEAICYNGYLKRECAGLDIPYFDQSESFTDTVETVLSYPEGGLPIS